MAFCVYVCMRAPMWPPSETRVSILFYHSLTDCLEIGPITELEAIDWPEISQNPLPAPILGL